MGVSPDAEPRGPLGRDGAELDAREQWLDSMLGRYVGYLGLAIGVALTPFLYEPTPVFMAGVVGTAPASATIAKSRRGCRRLRMLTGTGFAQPRSGSPE